jgi:hypothetical protein
LTQREVGPVMGNGKQKKIVFRGTLSAMEFVPVCLYDYRYECTRLETGRMGRCRHRGVFEGTSIPMCVLKPVHSFDAQGRFEDGI